MYIQFVSKHITTHIRGSVLGYGHHAVQYNDRGYASWK